MHIGGVYVCVKFEQVCAAVFDWWDLFSIRMRWTNGVCDSVFLARGELDLIMIAYNRVVIELSGNSWKVIV